MEKKVLITGGSGFVGQFVIDELLKRNYTVHATIHSNTLPEKNGLIQHQLDLLNTKAVEHFLSQHHFDHLIHLAWYTGSKCHSADINLDWIMATLHLLQCFQKNGGKHFLGAGSVSEYEYQYGYLLEDETPASPGTLYGESKNAVYKIAKAFCNSHNMIFTWARIFNLYGPGEKPQRLMPAVINACLNGENVKVSDCLKFQDYLYVEDSARGIVDAFETDLTGAVNISSGKPIQLRVIVNLIAQLTNFKGEILWGAMPAAFGNEVVVGNNAKLKTTGWEEKNSLEEGLKKTIHWWKKYNKELLHV